MKTLGERDYSAQETMHHLLSLKLHSSSFKVVPVSLNGSRRVRIESSLEEGQLWSDNSLLDVYANRHLYDRSAEVSDLNFVQFTTQYKIVNKKLSKLPENIVPRIFPTYSPDPKGSQFALYCKYQLLRYKPWKITQDNAWDHGDPTDEHLILKWQELLETPYAQYTVPNWFDKLQMVVQSQQETEDDTVNLDSRNMKEEWIIISDHNTPFENSPTNGLELEYDWQEVEAIILFNRLVKCQPG